MKTILFLILTGCILLGTSAYAQRQNTYLLKKNGDYVKNADSADYIRIVQEPEQGSTLYPTKEFYASGNKKSYGYSSRIDPPCYEGQYLSFFENGMKKKFLQYIHGNITDSLFSYFPNGKLYSALYYTKSGDSSIIYMESLNDSTGVVLVSKGNGQAVLYDEDFKHITGKGTVKNGKNDGEWTGELRGTDTLRYKETWVEGKMLSGESTDAKGNVYQYTSPEVKPQFKGGMKEFYKQIARGTRYPPKAVAQRIQGVAHIHFVILTNGEISNVHAMNDVHPELAAEAVRIVKQVKGWQPGSQKGRLVKVSYNVPISFRMSR
jgi:TonB family protein